MDITKIDHINVLTNNLESSIKFYTENLGFTLKGIQDYPEMKFRLACLEHRDVVVELMETYDISKNTGLKHFAVSCEGIEKIYNKLKENNVKILHGGIQRHGKISLFFIKGPSGELIEFIE